MFSEILVGCITPILLYIIGTYVKHLFKCQKLPPGPFPLPVIGNLHLLVKDPQRGLERISKRYGDIFSISFGMERFVVVCDLDSIKEVLIEKGTMFAGRPKSYVAKISTRNYQNVALGDYSPIWILMHKIMKSSMRVFEDEKEALEKIVEKESEELNKRILKSNYVESKINDKFVTGVMNVLCGIVFGTQYEENDKELEKVISFKQLILDGVADTFAISFLPWLRFFPSNGLKKVRKGVLIRDKLLRFQLKKHRETYNPVQIRDYTDYVLKYSKEFETSRNIDEQLSEDNMEMMLQDIFISGSETTISTLLWFAVYLVNWPKYQDDIYDETIKIVGNDRYPSLSDRPKLHLFESAMKETLRLSSVIPLGLPHRSLEETSIKKFKIPKNTNVMINLWQLHHDSKSWSDPHTFNPYRWLNDKNIFDKSKNPNYLPFSTGLRACLGYHTTESIIFLFFTRLIRDFNLCLKPGASTPSLNGVLRVTLTPDTSYIILKPRSNNLISQKIEA
ncbi:steroid 17-alpha-hydroxylase/17,20 lyase isoform X1 [Hydra vulgaris]|uniref:steroid 17-alpha-hydroxylase/17,20 lyase isoform X1 n=1 Tax=Hydra vulgaris TaxID=6087 RepID=UPI00064151E2|nr:steroid 17-alpha-hydroxylase/17,20 lyase [Hydra vulgaris]XP_047136966.1 steroid 17-alpha-hydroxylase/17,20 lyase [Hydra vulgaris]